MLVHLQNTDNARINPATEDKQDTLITAVAAGPATIESAMTHVVVNLDANAAAQELVAAPATGHQLWVYGYELHANIAGSYQFLSAATAKTGIMPVGANGGVAVMSPYPIFKCATAEALNIKSVTCAADGIVQYRDVTV